MEFAYAIKEVPVDPPKFTCCDQTSSLEGGHLGGEEGEDGGATDGSSARTARGRSTSPPSLALALSLSVPREDTRSQQPQSGGGGSSSDPAGTLSWISHPQNGEKQM